MQATIEKICMSDICPASANTQPSSASLDRQSGGKAVSFDDLEHMRTGLSAIAQCDSMLIGVRVAAVLDKRAIEDCSAMDIVVGCASVRGTALPAQHAPCVSAGVLELL